MTQPFLGQLLYAGFNFAPFRFAMCQGQQMAISQNTALFALLGTFYGGNGTSTFALPDMRGRMPVHFGQGAGLSLYSIGEITGSEHTSLTSGNIPAHTHTLVATTGKATASAPNTTPTPANPLSMLGRAVALTQIPEVYIPSGQSTGAGNMAAQSIAANVGGSAAFSILQPTLALSCSIALAGIFPARN